jgi:hypothetical protein
MTLKFPDLGSNVTIPLYRAPPELEALGQWVQPTAGPGEDPYTYEDYKSEHAEAAKEAQDHKDVTIEVTLVGSSIAYEWGLRTRGIRLRDARRLSDMREGTTKETAPDLWLASTMTEEGAREMQKSNMEILDGAFCRIHGVFVGDRDLSKLEPKEAVELLKAAGIASQIATRCIEAQSPDTGQFLV